LRKRHSALQLALREDLTARLLLRLADGVLDFALIALPYDTEGLLVRPLFEDELWLVAHAGDPLLAGKSITVLWKHYGRKPNFLELARAPSTVGPKEYIRRWGGWQTALCAYAEYRKERDAQAAE
jgi:DNA-binding transcriptional LysR family regulator